MQKCRHRAQLLRVNYPSESGTEPVGAVDCESRNAESLAFFLVGFTNIFSTLAADPSLELRKTEYILYESWGR